MRPYKDPRIAILISGRGSNMVSIIEACDSNFLKANVCLVISNNPNAEGLLAAKDAGLPTKCIDHRNYDNRELFDSAVLAVLNKAKTEFVLLAGFMRILTPIIIDPFLGRLINIHPSLLPKYPGLNTHQRAIDAGDKEAGATVHFVTRELDNGPAIAQTRVPILPTDTAETLAKKILEKEHQIYPLGAQLLIEKKIALQGNKAIMNNCVLPETGIIHA